MVSYIFSMGPIGLLNIIILTIVTIAGFRISYLLFIKKPQDKLAKLGRSINTMLFWAAIVLILGLLGAFIQLYTMIGSILGADAQGDPRVILAGIYGTLDLIIFSLAGFIVFSFVWFVFVRRHNRLLERSMSAMSSGN